MLFLMIQTDAPHLAPSPPTAMDAAFDQLWIHSQWQYDGAIPPEYFFPENINFPTLGDDPSNMIRPSLDDQLATDHLEDFT